MELNERREKQTRGYHAEKSWFIKQKSISTNFSRTISFCHCNILSICISHVAVSWVLTSVNNKRKSSEKGIERESKKDKRQRALKCYNKVRIKILSALSNGRLPINIFLRPVAFISSIIFARFRHRWTLISESLWSLYFSLFYAYVWGQKLFSLLCS